MATVQAIAALGTEKAARFLLKVVVEDDDQSIRLNTIHQVAKIPGAFVFDALLRLYRAGDETTRSTLFSVLTSTRTEALPTEIIDGFQAGGAQLVLDLDVAELHDGDRELLGHADILLVNRVGMERLAGDRGETRAVADLLTGRLHTLVVTLAADGCRLHTGEGVREIPGIPVDVVDVTGAGDTFGAAFLHALNRTGDPELAAFFATAASARAVTITGARAGVTTSGAVIEFIRQHSKPADERAAALESALPTSETRNPSEP